jgi:hypothetical protein
MGVQVLSLKYRVISMKTICLIIAIALSLGLASCDRIDLSSGIKGFSVPELKNVRFDNSSNLVAEVAPPNLISQLDTTIEKYQPQVAIVSPRSQATVQDTTVEVSLTVKDYPLFKDDRLGLGPHLNLIVDNEHYADIYDLDEPIIIKDLKPGTHTVRVLAEKPWHESFKNQEAFAQTTFDVLTETQDNNPNSELPFLTYNQPDGVYTAEPIMLDFYLTNVNRDDWQVRAKVNGESFTIDEWQPFYLKGFQEGNNLIELELLDSKGEVIENVFNKTIRLITYVRASTEDDTLAQLVSNKIPFAEAVAIAEPNYYIQPVGEPEEVETITEDLSLEAPSEEGISEPSIEAPSEEDVSEPSIEDNTSETVEEKITEDLETEAKEEAIEKVEETPVIKTEKEITTSKTTSDPQELARQEIPAKYFSNDDNIATTSTIEETTFPPQDQIEVPEKVTEIPVTEEIRIVETVETENNAIANTKKPDTITIKIPKPKLKVPQWWKNLIANFQQRFNVSQ